MINKKKKGFKCVDFFREVKNRMSVQLNAMTPEERRLYSERLNIETLDFFKKIKRKQII